MPDQLSALRTTRQSLSERATQAYQRQVDEEARQERLRTEAARRQRMTEWARNTAHFQETISTTLGVPANEILPTNTHVGFPNQCYARCDDLWFLVNNGAVFIIGWSASSTVNYWRVHNLTEVGRCLQENGNAIRANTLTNTEPLRQAAREANERNNR